jgi:hypothetical protein
MLLSGSQLRLVIDVATNLVPPPRRDLFLRSLAGCPLLGVKRTSRFFGQMSAFDP